MVLIRGIFSGLVIIAFWQTISMVFDLPGYILPTPILVLKSLYNYGGLIFQNSIPTLIEAVIGLFLVYFGDVLGVDFVIFSPNSYLVFAYFVSKSSFANFCYCSVICYLVWVRNGL